MKGTKKIAIIVFLMSLGCVFFSGILVGQSRGIPFIKKKDVWSIGIYQGNSPFNISSTEDVQNPVLTAEDVTDIDAEFVADPFLVKEDEKWYMFFEVLNEINRQGDIGLASSYDGKKWQYEKIVLDESFHLSYPYVFKWGNDYYMIPESISSNGLRLYKASHFPEKWEFVQVLLDGHYADPSIFYHNNKWWLFAETNGHNFDTLRLYSANILTGPWVEHPKSPVVKGDARLARPGGRVVNVGNRLFRFAQDCELYYGREVNAVEITKLTIDDYEEKEVTENPILSPTGSGWNAVGMHQIDLQQVSKNKWIAAVDGYKKDLIFGLKY